MKLGLGQELTKYGGTSDVHDFHVDVASGQTDAVVIAAPTDSIERIRILQMTVLADADSTTAFGSKFAAETTGALTGALKISEAGGYVMPYSPHGWIGATRGAALVVATGAGAVKIFGSYIRLKK